MKNILHADNRDEILNRINKIEADSGRRWGKMSVEEMLCHTADQIRMATGMLKTRYIGNYLQSTLLKQLVLFGMPLPKGKVETTNELKQGAGGTQPSGFQTDKKLLSALTKQFENDFKDGMQIKHPAFGNMNKKQWGRLVYRHLDHHLKQFGC